MVSFLNSLAACLCAADFHVSADNDPALVRGGRPGPIAGHTGVRVLEAGVHA